MREVLVKLLNNENQSLPSTERYSNCTHVTSVGNVNVNSVKHLTTPYNILKMIHTGVPFCSFEISPPTTDAGTNDLLSSINNLGICSPIFYSLTWHLEPSCSSVTDSNRSLNLASIIRANSCNRQEILLHLTARGLSKELVLIILNKAMNLGINNIFVLRGDRSNETLKGDFLHASDLVLFIRKQFGKQFVICVAGYPSCHPEAESYEMDLKYLKQKVDAGADFIITQILFETQSYFKFTKDCEDIGIIIPIIPGIMPIQSYTSLLHLSRLCSLNIPRNVLDILEPIKDNSESVMNFGIHLSTEMGRLLLSHSTPGIHFFTLNRDFAVLEVCKQLGFNPPQPTKPLQLHEMKIESNSVDEENIEVRRPY